MTIIQSLRGFSPAKLITNPEQVQAYLKSTQASQYLYNSNLIQSYLTSEHHVTGNYDVTPDAFVFASLAKQVLNTVVTSNTVTISGLDTNLSLPVIITGTAGATFSINSGAYTTIGSVNNGDTLRLKVATAGSYETNTPVTIQIGTYVTTWNVITTDQYSGVTVCYAPLNGDLIEQTNNSYIYLSAGSPVWMTGPYGGTTQAVQATNYTLRLDGAATQFGTGDFTIEFWVYATNFSVTAGLIASGYNAFDSPGFGILTESSGLSIMNYQTVSGEYYLTSFKPSNNAWHRIVFERMAIDSTFATFSLWCDGVIVSQKSKHIYNKTRYQWTLGGRYYYNGPYFPLTCFFSDLRMTASARYQGASTIAVPSDYTGF